MRFFQIDPTRDARWANLVEQHSSASIFHTVGWLEALRRTYGYEPIAFTTSPPTGDLKNGLVFCRVDSWLTGARLVSLPFSDHCEPLCDSAEDANFLIRFLQTAMERKGWKYLELRPVAADFGETGNGPGLLPSTKYFFHSLCLRSDLNELFRGFDKDSVQRRVRRAERAGLVEKCGRSDDLLEDFYALFVRTRSRHRLPPIPRVWFQNLIQCLGDAMDIRVAYERETPVASIITLRFRDVAYYKYGCSNKRLNRYGATPWLLWRAITAAKISGASEFDMGRTEEDNADLLRFKNHWVAQPDHLVYWKFPYSSSLDSAGNWKLQLAKRIFSYMPNRLLTITGRLIYRHIG